MNNTCDDEASQATFKGKKITKLVCGVGLAVLMGAMAFLGAACTPSSAATSGTQGAQSAAGAADGGSTTSSFNLNPETDPTLFTTQSGLEIKFGGATVESGSLAGYTYFTMGTYGGNPVNWVIIGRHSQGFSDNYQHTLAQHLLNISDRSEAFQDWVNDGFEIDTPAGDAIWGDNLADDRIVLEGANITFSSLEATGTTIDSELDPGEVLVISQTTLGSSTFDGDSSYTNDYNSTDCELKKYIENLYTTNLGLTDTQKSLIQPQSLNNLYYNSATSTTSNAYMFPLAGRGENFNMSTYLTTNALRDIDAYYWLRSGSASDDDIAYYVYTDGSIYSYSTVRNSYGVRPAFVLNLA